MSTSQQEIKVWLEDAKKHSATHVVIVCDTFNHEDYPVPVSADENVQDVFNEYDGKDMQRVMEVYALHLDLDKQLSEFRAFHFETATG